jgi:hypothetical protein
MLGESAFCACKSLQSICLPASLETVSKFCFIGCDKLADLTFESGSHLSTLGESAFANCPSLHSICLPASVETVSDSCFTQCQSLSKLIFEAGCKNRTLGCLGFFGCSSLRSICVPPGLRQDIGLAIRGSGIDRVTADVDNPFLRVSDDFLVDSDGLGLIRYFGNERDVAIERGVETISAGCFAFCQSVLSVSSEQVCQVSTRGDPAFEKCSSLESICIPSSIATISKHCFADCTALSSLTFEAGRRISTLGESAFGGCSSL